MGFVRRVSLVRSVSLIRSVSLVRSVSLMRSLEPDKPPLLGLVDVHLAVVVTNHLEQARLV